MHGASLSRGYRSIPQLEPFPVCVDEELVLGLEWDLVMPSAVARLIGWDPASQTGDVSVGYMADVVDYAKVLERNRPRHVIALVTNDEQRGAIARIAKSMEDAGVSVTVMSPPQRGGKSRIVTELIQEFERLLEPQEVPPLVLTRKQYAMALNAGYGGPMVEIEVRPHQFAAVEAVNPVKRKGLAVSQRSRQGRAERWR